MRQGIAGCGSALAAACLLFASSSTAMAEGKCGEGIVGDWATLEPEVNATGLIVWTADTLAAFRADHGFHMTMFPKPDGDSVRTDGRWRCDGDNIELEIVQVNRKPIGEKDARSRRTLVLRRITRDRLEVYFAATDLTLTLERQSSKSRRL
jgi:hypothetical protein